MTAESTTLAAPERRPTELPKLRAGWITIAAKEPADHLLSIRL